MERIDLHYAPRATPLDPDEAEGLIPSHIVNQAQLNEWEMQNIVSGEYRFAAGVCALLTRGWARNTPRRINSLL
jgi:hypothetical protein